MSEISVNLHGVGLVPQSLHLGGQFHCTQIRNGVVIDEWVSKNVVTDEGINHALNVIFNDAAKVSTWYLGVFKNDYTPVSGDTAATFVASAGEATTEYSEGTRQPYVEATSTAKSITNSANKATITCATAVTLRGAFLTSLSTKGGVSGVLMAASKFTNAKSLEVGDQLQIVYTINGATA